MTLVSRAELADWLGLSPAAVSNLRTSGVIERRDDEYDLKASVQAYIAHLRKDDAAQEVSRSVCSCAGFSDACITKPSTRSHDRRPRSAKARNRGPEGARFRRRDLWGFEACERQFSRGRNYGHAAL